MTFFGDEEQKVKAFGEKQGNWLVRNKTVLLIGAGIVIAAILLWRCA